MSDATHARVSPGPAAAVLHALRDRLDGDTVSLGDLVGHLGERAPGFLLLALAMPTVVPSPGIPVGVVFGTVLAVVALQMAAGRDRLHLPDWVARRRVPRALVDRMLARAAPVMEWIERRMAPRLPGLTRRGAVRPLGVLTVLMGFLIALPIPFGNTLPGLAVMVVALGLLAHDGLAVAIGIGIATAAVAASAALLVGSYMVAVMAIDATAPIL